MFLVAFICFPSSPKLLFLLGWHLHGGSALPPTTATITAARRQGPLLLVAGHVPHGRQLQTTCRRRCSSEHASRLGFLVALALRQLPRSSAASRPKPHPPNLFTPRSASLLHPASQALGNCLHSSASSQHKPLDRPSTCTFFAIWGVEAYARAKDRHIGINTSSDQQRRHRLLTAPTDCVHLCQRSQTDARGPPWTASTVLGWILPSCMSKPGGDDQGGRDQLFWYNYSSTSTRPFSSTDLNFDTWIHRVWYHLHRLFGSQGAGKLQQSPRERKPRSPAL